MTPSILAVCGSLVLAMCCILAPLLNKLPGRYQASIFSMSAGAGLAYIFLYLLFELVSEGAPKIHAIFALGPHPLETLFILLLIAVSVTHIIQIIVETTHSRHDDHIVLAVQFFLYNLLAGIGMVEEAFWGTTNLALYAMAIGLHVLFNELFLLHRYATFHSLPWRLLLGAAPLLGCSLAIALPVPEGLLYVALAMIAGVTIINVLRHELPGHTGFRPAAFIAGIAGYGLLIILTWRF